MNTDKPHSDASLRAFERSLPMALLRSREAVMRQFRPILAAHGLTEQQWRVLRALSAAAGPMTVGELAASTLILGPSLSRMLRTLEDAGLVQRSADPADGRASSVTLTRKATRLVATIGPLSEERYDWIAGELGEDTLTQLYELLHRVASLGDPPDVA